MTKKTIKAKKIEHTITPLFSSTPKVLMADDNGGVQVIQRFMLTELGCETHVARDGVVAMELFEKNTYDLILLDIHMPRLDGINTAKKIRAREKTDPEYDHKNILIACTFFRDTVFNLCREAGFDDFYDKPVLEERLTELLKKWLPEHLMTA
jgi:CheY-like chemotaxis protein